MADEREAARAALAPHAAQLRDGLAIGMKSIGKIDAEWQRVADALVDVERFARRAGVLAVNAAIEAASADHSGGFSIVAQRMRSLSSSTLEAARSVGALVVQARRHTGTANATMHMLHAIATRACADLERGADAEAVGGLLKMREAPSANADIIATDDATREAEAILGRIVDVAGDAQLLAINAAIEAARAGKLGAGFAVIADEIGVLSHAIERTTGEVVGELTSIAKRSARLRAATEGFGGGFVGLHGTTDRLAELTGVRG